MSIDEILSRLDRVKKTGTDRWIACCPAHEDRSPSLSIRMVDNGRVLLHCFANCPIKAVLDALHLTPADLFPERLTHHLPPQRRAFPAFDVLCCIAFEALVVVNYASALRAGNPPSPAEYDRLLLATSRLLEGAELAGVFA